MGLFVRLTAIVAVALVALFVAFVVLKIVIVAALIAGAVMIGGLVWNALHRRSRLVATRPPVGVRRM